MLRQAVRILTTVPQIVRLVLYIINYPRKFPASVLR